MVLAVNYQAHDPLEKLKLQNGFWLTFVFLTFWNDLTLEFQTSGEGGGSRPGTSGGIEAWAPLSDLGPRLCRPCDKYANCSNIGNTYYHTTENTIETLHKICAWYYFLMHTIYTNWPFYQNNPLPSDFQMCKKEEETMYICNHCQTATTFQSALSTFLQWMRAVCACERNKLSGWKTACDKLFPQKMEKQENGRSVTNRRNYKGEGEVFFCVQNNGICAKLITVSEQ